MPYGGTSNPTAPPYVSPYWNPQQSVTGPYDYGTTQWGKSMLEQSPETAIYRYGRAMGIPDDQSDFSRWFKQRYQDVLGGYKAYTVSNPYDANITSYLNTLGGVQDWQRRYAMQAPSMRGINPAAAGAGPARWIGR